MKIMMRATITLLLLSLGILNATTEKRQINLPRSTPEEEGVSSAGILAFVEAVEQKIDALHSFVLVRHGHVVAEGYWAPYNAQSPHELYSLSKSFTSTAVGMATAEGKISVDDEVLKFFPGAAPAELSENLKAMRVRDLLRMSTGQTEEVPTAPDKISTKSFLAQPVPFKPGTHFKYNTPATYMLSAIVQKATGMTVLDYLRPRLFEPLGIERPVWSTSAQGITLGGYGLRIRTMDIARFGQLYLQKGKWQGRQLLPASWVEAATALQTSNGSNPDSDWDQGYGYQFWRCRYGAFRGDGAFGQYCIVMPAQDAVLAITSGVKDMQVVLNVVWSTLLPGMKTGRVPADQASRKRLEAKLAGLVLRTQQGASTSPLVAKISGRKFAFPANGQRLEEISLQVGDGGPGAMLTMQTAGGQRRITCGQGEWIKGSLPYGLSPDEPVAASGAWIAEDTYAAKLYFYETPFCLSLQLRFAGDQLFFDSEANVSFGSTRQARLVGQAQ